MRFRGGCIISFSGGPVGPDLGGGAGRLTGLGFARRALAGRGFVARCGRIGFFRAIASRIGPGRRVRIDVGSFRCARGAFTHVARPGLSCGVFAFRRRYQRAFAVIIGMNTARVFRAAGVAVARRGAGGLRSVIGLNTVARIAAVLALARLGIALARLGITLAWLAVGSRGIGLAVLTVPILGTTVVCIAVLLIGGLPVALLLLSLLLFALLLLTLLLFALLLRLLRDPARLGLGIHLARGFGQHAGVMLRVLQEILGRDPVVRQLGIAGKYLIFLNYLLRRAAHFAIRARAVENAVYDIANRTRPVLLGPRALLR